MTADDIHYHAEKLGLGSLGHHEGWLQAEEAEAAANADRQTDRRQQMIAVAAYYLAEKRGFAGDGADQDWMAAEAEVDATMQARN
ncbi:MAG: DUF2934 domain-containing protein [Thiobacillus sp.]|nr:DUF2934 domain-containing protein [Thiobacillus sp.]